MPFILTEYCPKCGEPLIVRRRRKDNAKFIGCCAYPNCKFACNYEPAIDEAGQETVAMQGGARDSYGIDWDKELRALVVMVHPDRATDQTAVTSHLNFLRDKVRGKAA